MLPTVFYFKDIHGVGALQVVDVALVVLINKKVKRVVPIGIVPCSIVNQLISSLVEPCPLCILFSEVDSESLAKAEEFVCWDFTSNFNVVIAIDELGFVGREKDGLGVCSSDFEVKRIFGVIEVSSTN